MAASIIAYRRADFSNDFWPRDDRAVLPVVATGLGGKLRKSGQSLFGERAHDIAGGIIKALPSWGVFGREEVHGMSVENDQ